MPVGGYTSLNFTPGNKANLRLLLQKHYLQQYYSAFNINNVQTDIDNADQITQANLCSCYPYRVNKIKQGYVDPSKPQNRRISEIVTGPLGGKIMFGNFNLPVSLTFLGGWEGQPGGLQKPPRNFY
jgi:hypothetical protein